MSEIDRMITSAERRVYARVMDEIKAFLPPAMREAARKHRADGSAPQLVTGEVVSADGADVAVHLDGDDPGSAVNAKTLGWSVAPGNRVMVAFVPRHAVYIAGPIGLRPAPQCRTTRSAPLTLLGAAPGPTTVTFDVTRYAEGVPDPDNLHSDSTSNEQIKVPTGWAGGWDVGGAAQFASNATGRRALALFHLDGETNVATEIDAVQVDAATGGTTVLSLATAWRAQVGDAFYMTAYQTSGVDLDLTLRSGEFPFLWSEWRGP